MRRALLLQVARPARALLAVMFVLGLLRAGTAYYLCSERTHAMLSAPCCEQHQVEDHGRPTVDRAPCCTRAYWARWPSMSTGAELVVAQTPLVATLAASPIRPIRTTSAIDDVTVRSRGRPPPNDTSQPRLMVFHL